VLVNGNHGLLQIKSAEFFYLKKMVDDGDPIDYDKQRNFASEVFNGHYMKKKKKSSDEKYNAHMNGNFTKEILIY
jgi:hypothetical protein